MNVEPFTLSCSRKHREQDCEPLKTGVVLDAPATVTAISPANEHAMHNLAFERTYYPIGWTNASQRSLAESHMRMLLTPLGDINLRVAAI